MADPSVILGQGKTKQKKGELWETPLNAIVRQEKSTWKMDAFPIVYSTVTMPIIVN